MLNLPKLITVIIANCYAIFAVAAIAYGLEKPRVIFLMKFEPQAFLSYLPLGLAIVFVIGLIIMTPLSDGFLSLFFTIRKVTMREQQRIDRAVSYIQAQYSCIHGKSLKIKVFVQDTPYPQGMTFGRRIVVISTGLLKTTNDDELMAVIAHEVGHIHHKDAYMNWLIQIPVRLVLMPLGFISLSGDNENSVPSVVIGLILILIMVRFSYYAIIFFALMPFSWLRRFVDFITDWPIEYRADQFATSLGFGRGLISFFERLEGEDIRKGEGFLSTFMYSHPPVASRIDRVERQMIVSSSRAI